MNVENTPTEGATTDSTPDLFEPIRKGFGMDLEPAEPPKDTEKTPPLEPVDPKSDPEDDAPATAEDFAQSLADSMGAEDSDVSTEPPEGIDPEAWKEFQAFQAWKQGQAPAQGEGADPAPTPAEPKDEDVDLDKVPEDLATEEEWQEALLKPGKAKQIFDRSYASKQALLDAVTTMEGQLKEELTKAANEIFARNLYATEMMQWLALESQNTPELLEHQDTVMKAIDWATRQNKDADPRIIVQEATKVFKDALRIKGGVEKTLEAGRKVDVRGKQKPPEGKTQPRVDAEGDEGTDNNNPYAPILKGWR